MQETKALKGESWLDTDFGPTTDDPHGHNSIYAQEDP